MKKLYISHPNVERSPEEEVEFKQKIVEKVSTYIDEIVTLLPEYPNDDPEAYDITLLVYSLAMMSAADVVYFAHGWENSRECVIQHMCALQYGLITIEA